MRYRFPLLIAACVTCFTFGDSRPPGLAFPIPNSEPRPKAFLQAQGKEPTEEPGTTLKLGSQGAEVKELQNQLNQLDYLDGEINGVYGESTKNAVSRFQESVGLQADGIAGQSTLDRLQAAFSKGAYDRYMQEGYEATNQGDYQKALESFRKALDERPGNSYAQEAISNVEGYQQLERQDLFQSLLVLVLVLAVAGVGGGLFFALRESRKTARKAEPEPMFDGEEIPQPDSFEKKRERDVERKATSTTVQSRERALPVQQTTRLPNIDIVEELIKDLQEPNPTKRRKAIWELAQRGDSRAVTPLVELLIDSDSKQRSLILEALSQISTRALKPLNRALALSLQDENAEVRKNAIRDLTQIYELISPINKLLCHAADDPDAEVQETAQWALSQLSRIQLPPNFNRFSIGQNQPSPSENSRKEF